jgi:hypothetical protein
MTATVSSSKNRKALSPTERSSAVERERTGSKLSATLQWLANHPVVRPDEHIELVLVTWHPLILEDSYCEDDLAAQRILDRTVRQCAPRSTMVCGGHRVWWLLHSGAPALKLKNLKRRIERSILKQAFDNPLFEKLDDSLIVQRIGCWNGQTTNAAKGLAGIFADMAAGQTLLDNFGLPYERQYGQPADTKKQTATKQNQTGTTKPQSARAKSSSNRSAVSKPRGSAWISNPAIPSLGQFQATPSPLAPLLQLS